MKTFLGKIVLREIPDRRSGAERRLEGAGPVLPPSRAFAASERRVFREMERRRTLRRRSDVVARLKVR